MLKQLTYVSQSYFDCVIPSKDNFVRSFYTIVHVCGQIMLNYVPVRSLY